MRKYREYIIYIAKSISNSAAVYPCMYLVSAILFDIHPGSLMFFTGVFISLLSLAFHHAAKKKYRSAIGRYKSIAWGLLPSGLLCLMFIKDGYIEAVISTLYSLYLWKLAFEMYETGIRYDVYREKFINWLRILLGVTVISALYGEKGLISAAGRYSVMYVILGPVILRNCRELDLAQTSRSQKNEAFNIAVNLAVAVLLMLISSDGFILYLKAAANIALTMVDKILGYGVMIIAYPIGIVIEFIANRIKLNIKLDDIKINIGQQNSGESPYPAETRPFLPYNIEIALKIILLVIIAFVLIKKYSKHPKKASKDDYTESKEFIVSTRDLGDGIRKSIASLASRFRRKGRLKPVTYKDKIRYLYYSFLELGIRHGIYRNVSQTPRDIGEKTREYSKESTKAARNLTAIYENTRYSQNHVFEEDYKNAEESFIEIKNKLDRYQHK